LWADLYLGLESVLLLLALQLSLLLLLLLLLLSQELMTLSQWL
jgi:hypothetical protein